MKAVQRASSSKMMADERRARARHAPRPSEIDSLISTGGIELPVNAQAGRPDPRRKPIRCSSARKRGSALRFEKTGSTSSRTRYGWRSCNAFSRPSRANAFCRGRRGRRRESMATQNCVSIGLAAASTCWAFALPRHGAGISERRQHSGIVTRHHERFLDLGDRLGKHALLDLGLADPHVAPEEVLVELQRGAVILDRFIVPAGVVERVSDIRRSGRRQRVDISCRFLAATASSKRRSASR